MVVMTDKMAAKTRFIQPPLCTIDYITIMEDEATGALPSPTSASVAHLKVNGTAIVASFAASRSAIAIQTRSLRSARSRGQM